ncbi:MAG: glyceraldehyde 3-phosphate dehydrogenase NAD-binding domain-containing protein [Candidatus Methanoperedens sp.]|nr:glyceraldehyde 3-phosphate dehydrogenase NAD-binding domain-containing protein [Candidatus Methanoperedens sp.]
MARIAINGFGRIGRIFFRVAHNNPDFEIVAINDLADKENLIYLLRHDSVYGRFNISDEEISKIKFFQERDPANLPWKELDIDIVVESSGFFTSYEKAKAHLEAGAKRVVITAPPKDYQNSQGLPFGNSSRVVLGESLGEGSVLMFTPNAYAGDISKTKITSNASCTTNATIPVAAIMLKNPGVKKAVLSTVHGYTSSQGMVDKPDTKDWRRGRTGAVNIVPSSTGAAKAAGKILTELAGKFDGVAIRVPVPSGSRIDFTFVSARPTSVEEINNIFRGAAQSAEWQGILKIADKATVSSDILGEPYGSIVDLDMTRVIDGDLVKIFSWYDNEWGYCAMLMKHIEQLKNYL